MMRRRTTSLSGAPTGRPRPHRPEALPTPRMWPRRLVWAGGFALVGGLLVWLLWPVLSILIAAACIAYLLDPVIDRLERRGMSRETGIGTVLVLMVLAVGAIALLVVPPFLRKLGELGNLLSDFFSNLGTYVEPVLGWVHTHTGYNLPVDVNGLQQEIPGWIHAALPRIQGFVTTMFQGLFTRGMGIINAVLNLTLLPLFAFYLLRDWDRVVAKVADTVPVPIQPRVQRVAREVDGRLTAFVRGQLTVCAALGVLYSAGLWIAGIDMPFTVGMLSGALFIVPYLGTMVGIVLATLLSLAAYGLDIHLLWVGLVFGIAQAIEGYVLTPRIVGNKVGLHPLVVIVALIAAGSLLGIWGMLLAIPVTATLSVLGHEWLAAYRASTVYTGKEATP